MQTKGHGGEMAEQGCISPGTVLLGNRISVKCQPLLGSKIHVRLEITGSNSGSRATQQLPHSTAHQKGLVLARFPVLVKINLCQGLLLMQELFKVGWHSA